MTQVPRRVTTTLLPHTVKAGAVVALFLVPAMARGHEVRGNEEYERNNRNGGPPGL